MGRRPDHTTSSLPWTWCPAGLPMARPTAPRPP